MTAPLRLKCRAIAEADAPAIVRLLTKGFPDRTASYWARALDRLSAHARRLPVPACGYLLENEGDVVGVLLLIHAAQGADLRRCNLSSWYVEPPFQGYASLLVSKALRQKDMTFLNISPATHTWPTIEAQGFVRYSRGRVLALPALGPLRRAETVRAFDPGAADHADVVGPERDLLVRHTAYGCLALCVTTPDGTRPFLFLPRRIKGWVPSVQLIYTRDIADLVRFGGLLGRHLLRQGRPVLWVDADGPIAGLAGRFLTDRTPKYFKGPVEPRLGDLTDTELVMFGP